MSKQKLVIINKNKAIQFVSLEPEGSQVELKGGERIEIEYAPMSDTTFELEMLSTENGTHLTIWPERVSDYEVLIDSKNIFNI